MNFLNSPVNQIYIRIGDGSGTIVSAVDIGNSDWIAEPFQGWREVKCKITGATNQTKITINNTVDGQWYMDDIKITEYDGKSTNVAQVTELPMAPGITIRENPYPLHISGGDVRVKVLHNVECSCTTNADWVSVTDQQTDNTTYTNGSVTEYTFRVEDMGSLTQERVAQVTLTSTANNLLSKTFEIVQKPIKDYVVFPVKYSSDMAHLSFGPYNQITKSGLRDYADDDIAYVEYVNNSTGVRFIPVASETLNYYCITPLWTGDYMQFVMPVENLAAGTKIRFTAALTAGYVNGSTRFYSVDYMENGSWVSVETQKHATYTIGSTTYSVDYNYELTDRGANVPVDVTAQLANPIVNGMLRFRVRLSDSRFIADNITSVINDDGTNTGFRIGANPTFSIVQ